MNNVFICQKCNKRVKPKKGWLSCCGISERVSYSKKMNEEFQARKKIAIGSLEKAILDNFDDDTDYFDTDGVL